jgi:4,5-DOPA dioxygenase extradiol
MNRIEKGGLKMNHKMPVLFVGHGSPMNAIEDNRFAAYWRELGNQISRPQVILSVSAHWCTGGSLVADSAEPKMVYDMYGFPDELYHVKYPVKGSPETARRILALTGPSVKVDNSWGIDHGTWSVLCRMFPKADIPVLQLSVDAHSEAAYHYELGKKLAPLRESGVLILGSGNIVHNLGRVEWGMDGGQPWAEEFDRLIKDKILKGQHKDIIHYERMGASAKLSVPTPDHFNPLLYILGASSAEDKVTVFNESCTMGSMSMTSYLIGAEL